MNSRQNVTLNAKNRSDHDQSWHACADRSGNGSYLKKLIPNPRGRGRSWNFRGSKNQKSGKCHELSRKAIQICLAHPPRGIPGGCGGGGGWGSTFQKSGKFHELPRKSRIFFTHPPPRGVAVGILGGQKIKSPGNVMNCREK